MSRGMNMSFVMIAGLTLLGMIALVIVLFMTRKK
jgi:hypothetical protein